MFTAEPLRFRIVRFLKKSLHRRASSTKAVEAEAGIQVYPYVSLLGAAEFWTVLASEYDKVAPWQKNLAVICIAVPECPPERVEEVGVFLRGFLNERGTVFLYSPICFAIILSNTGPGDAALFSSEVFNQVQMRFPEEVVLRNFSAFPEIVNAFGEFDPREPGNTRVKESGVLAFER